MNAASSGGLTIQNDGRLVFADSSDADEARVVSSSGATVRFSGSATGARRRSAKRREAFST
jgi:hypothetical protein